MPNQRKRIERTLKKRGVNPSTSFIVVKPRVYVPSDDLKTLEIFQFISSFFALIGGVFLGIVTTPNTNHPFFYVHLVIGIILVLVGIGVFYIGVHRQIERWEREKEPLQVS